MQVIPLKRVRKRDGSHILIQILPEGFDVVKDEGVLVSPTQCLVK